MGKLYYIETKNDYNQILIFESKQAATYWALTATRWSFDKIKQEIKTVEKVGNCQYFSIFPDPRERLSFEITPKRSAKNGD